SLCIVSHPARSLLMISDPTLTVSATPGLNGPGFLQENFPFIHHVICDLIVDLHPGVGDSRNRHAPRVPNFRVEVYAVCFLRQSLAVAAEVEVAAKILALKFLVSRPPEWFARRPCSGEFDGKRAVIVVNVASTGNFAAARMIPVVEGDRW